MLNSQKLRTFGSFFLFRLFNAQSLNNVMKQIPSTRYAVRTGTEKKGFEYLLIDGLPAALELWQSCTAKEKPAIINRQTGRIIKEKG